MKFRVGFFVVDFRNAVSPSENSRWLTLEPSGESGRGVFVVCDTPSAGE